MIQNISRTCDCLNMILEKYTLCTIEKNLPVISFQRIININHTVLNKNSHDVVQDASENTLASKINVTDNTDNSNRSSHGKIVRAGKTLETSVILNTFK